MTQAHGPRSAEGFIGYADTPEQAAPTPDFVQALTPSPEFVEYFRTELWRITDAATATAANPHERDALVKTAALLERNVCDPFGPLPQAAVVFIGSKGMPAVTFNSPSADFDSDCVERAYRRLGVFGVGKIIDAFEESLRYREHEVKEALEAMICATPEYAFLESLDIELTDRAEQRPLAPARRQEREERIIREARRSHSLPETERLQRRTHPGVAKAASRGLQYMEEETERRQAQTEAPITTLQRAKDFLTRNLIDHVARVTGQKVTSIEPYNYAPSSSSSVRIYDDNGKEVQLLSVYRKLELDGEFGNSPADIPYYLGAGLFTRAIRRVLAAPPERSYGEVLRGVVDDEIEESIYTLTGVSSSLYMMFNRRHTANTTAIHGAPGGAPHHSCNIVTSQAQGFASREELERLKRQPLGFAMPSPAAATGGLRVVQAVPAASELPERADSDLRLFMVDSKLWENRDPYLPGFRLVSRRGHNYGFKRDEAGDPYAAADIPLSEVQRATLRDAYLEIGLESLAAAVDRSEHLTVDELQKLIAGYSTYGYYTPDGPLPKYFTATTVSDFRKLVIDGKLHMQCNANILGISLEAIFGKGATASVSGYTFNGSRVLAVQHAQTLFTHGGRTYILDATPSDGSYMSNTTPDATSNCVAPATFTAQRPEQVERGSLPPLQDKTPAEQLADARKKLELYLSTALGVPNPDALYDAVLKLPAHDPVRRTLEFTLRATKGTASAEEAATLQDYLRQYAQADERLLRETGLPQYDARLVTMLTRLTTDAQRAVVQVQKTPTLPEVASSELGVSGSGSVYEVRQAIEAQLAELPHQEVAAAYEQLQGALGMLAALLGESDHAATDVLSNLAVAQSAGALSLGYITSAIADLRAYVHDITGA